MANIVEGCITDYSEVFAKEKKVLHVPDKEYLENKEHIALLKATLLSNENENENDELCYNMYGDEHDDTYDSYNVGANDIDEFKELTSRRKFTIPAALRQIGDVSSESGEEGDEEDDDHDDDGEEESQLNHQPPLSRSGDSQRSGQRHGPVSGDSCGSKRSRGCGGRGSRSSSDRGSRGNCEGYQREGDQNKANQSNMNRGSSSNCGRGRGGGRRKQNRRRQGDKKRSQGMMPY